ncbi:MAG: heme lyase CcmF/NrfE family subunit [Gammaproteobacteria bacterium]|nr:MAG: heme lyase CcmF/NrfE family subunit [Gammaproteobacteria bacterium]TLZ43678.1 MAG: heme lyase CcmF/NrfE family subunit [Gammaproteobacteria bacterium]
MLPELGHFALILALLLAGLQAFFGIAGPMLGRERWMAAVTPAVAGQFVMVSTAVGCLIASFVGNEFSVVYVAENSNSALPLFYRVTALWGAHEGSLLLWILLLAAWTVAVSIGAARLPRRFGARVLGVLGVVSFGFLLFTLATSNPFLRLDPAAPDGRDLNPILQDPALAVHPPILYTGYVGFAVAFAFACAAMLEGKLDQAWARWTRPWTTTAWGFLTCGIALGSFWAYYELGWGGFWFWDPVENASFMPWLVGTALIHSLAVTDKRGLFKSWTLLLAILAFSLSMLGTFLVRSGVLVSVHSFAADPTRGIFILAFLVLMIGGALALYTWRAPLLKSPAGFELGARESFLLFNNVLLVIAAATVFAGTLAPLISDALKLGTVSVGPPYFNPTFMLSMLPLLALLSVGVHANWKRGRLQDKQRTLLYTLIAGAVLACGVVFGIYSHGRVLTPVGATLAFWIVLASLVDPIDRWRRGLTLPRAVIGMTVAHLGLALAVLALTTVQSFTIEKDVALAPGGSVSAGGYQFRFDGVRPVPGPNYDAVGGTITVTRNGAPLMVLKPEKRHYWVKGTEKTETSIKMHHGANILVALGEDLGAGRWSVRIQIRPLVSFIWLAALIMAIGGAVAASDRRYRTARAAGTVPAGVATGDATT